MRLLSCESHVRMARKFKRSANPQPAGSRLENAGLWHDPDAICLDLFLWPVPQPGEANSSVLRSLVWQGELHDLNGGEWRGLRSARIQRGKHLPAVHGKRLACPKSECSAGVSGCFMAALCMGA